MLKRNCIQKRDALVLENVRIVLHFATMFAKNSCDRKDLMQEGIIGLMHAAERFDATRGVKFRTMAKHWVKKHVREAALSRGIIKTPLFWKWKNKLSDRAILLSQKMTRNSECVSLPGYDGMLSSMPDQQVLLHEKEKRNAVRLAIESLDATEYFIIYCYCNGDTMAEIGTKLHVSTQSISDTLTRITDKLRRHIAFSNIKRRIARSSATRGNQ